MRRRVRESSPGMPPARLRVYDPADWPSTVCHPECAYWEAVEVWREQETHDDDNPLVLFDGPDVPFHHEVI